MSSSSQSLSKPPKISQTAFQASIGVLLGLAVIVAAGRISARLYRSYRITVDDGFFLLALSALISGTTVLYFDIPYIYLQEDVEAGLRAPPTNLIPQLLRDEKLQDAAATLMGLTISSVKFSFLFFFKSLVKQQRKMMIWWWCICILLIPTTAILMFSNLMACPYFDERVIVKCVTPEALARENGILRASTILDVCTDAFLISIPVILLWNVQISLRRKLALWGILCLSVFTMITAVVRVAGGNINHGQVDSAWAIFWLQTEAAVAVIVVSMTAFRALFVAHRASKQQSPNQENGLSSRSTWSKRFRSRDNSLTPPSPLFTGVRTYIGKSSHNGSVSQEPINMELSSQGPGILVTKNISSKETDQDKVLRLSAESFV